MRKYKFQRQFLQTAVPLLLTVSIMLTGCGQTGNSDSPVRPILPDNSPDSSTVSSGEKLPDPVTIVVEDDSTPPAEGMVRSRLTNEWVDADVAATRPIAVMIPNEASAIPQYSLSDASIIYEANVENRMTRMMAIYEDWQNLDKIGNIRSLRDYYAYWAFEWDAFIVHFGGPFFINELLAQPDTQDVDGTSGSDEAAFFRTTDRNKPHNAYASGEGLQKVIEKKGYSLGYRGLSDENHFRFATKAEPNTLGQYGAKAKDATYIDMSGCYPLTRCYFEFNEDDGLYYRSQHLSGSRYGSAVLDTDSCCGCIIIDLSDALTDCLTYFLCLLGSSYLASTDSPDRLVCDDSSCCLCSSYVQECDLDLLTDEVDGNTLLSLRQSLTTADDGSNAMLESLENLLIHGLVGLCKVLSSLGVSDDHILHACIIQHCGRNLAGESTLLLEIHILRTNHDIGTLCCLHSGNDVDCGNAQKYVYFIICYEGL